MNDQTMRLGAYSVSLAVTDLAASRAFYEKLGFTVFGGEAEQGWLILRNGDANGRPVPGHVRAQHLDLQPGLGR